MKKYLLAGCFVFGFATHALAADPIETGYDWTGFYLGANVAGASSEGTWGPGTAGFNPFGVDGDGLGFGGQAGYRHQVGDIVFGVEGNFARLDMEATALCVGLTPTCVTEQNYLGSIQGNLGYAVDALYVYGTGGIAFTEFEHSQKDNAVQHWNKDKRKGWTVGLGAEYAINDNWSAGIQWNYYDFGSKTRGGGLGPVNIKFEETENVAAFRVNYKF